MSNPVQNRATIRYELAQNAQVNISVFNTLGQRVARLADERKDAGRQSIQFEASTLPSGVYFIRMQTEAVTETKRLTIVR